MTANSSYWTHTVCVQLFFKPASTWATMVWVQIAYNDCNTGGGECICWNAGCRPNQANLL